MSTSTKKILSSLFLAVILVSPLSHSFGQHTPSGKPADSESSAASSESTTPAANSPAANKEERDENEKYKQSASVKKMGSMLGLSTERAAVAFEVANFVVLAALLGWLLIRLLPKTFRDRTTTIQKHLVDARTATEEAALRLSGVEARLAKLDEEIAAMREKADKDLALEEQRIRGSIDEERKKILAAAEQEIAAATTQAQRQLQQYAAELAIEQAARKLAISAETDRLLVQNFARRLGGDGSKEGQN